MSSDKAAGGQQIPLSHTAGEDGDLEQMPEPKTPETGIAGQPHAAHPQWASGPKGPDLSVLTEVINAKAVHDAARRQKWRHRHKGLAAPHNPAVRLQVASEATLQFYRKRGLALIKRYKHEQDMRFSNEDLDPRAFVEWLLALQPSLSKNSWRTYRASACFTLQSIPSANAAEALARLNAGVGLGKDQGRSVCRNSAKPGADRFAVEHFLKLKDKLRATYRGQIVDWLIDWLDAGLNTGLRPAEWAFASIETRGEQGSPTRIFLHVADGNSPGEVTSHRTLELTGFSDETLAAIERLVKVSRDWALNGKTAMQQGEVSRLLQDACETFFPRLQLAYTLQSLRQQFIANMKSIYSRAEVAAMVGSVDIDRPPQHYSNRRQSWHSDEIPEKPRPVPEQVGRMHKRLQAAEERRELKELKLDFRRRREERRALKARGMVLPRFDGD